MRKFISRIAILCTVLIAAYLFFNKEEQRAPAATPLAQEPVKIESKQETISEPAIVKAPPRPAKVRKTFTKINDDIPARMMELRQTTDHAEIPSGLSELNEVPALQAVPRRQYQTRLGPELNRQSGYVVFKTVNGTSSVQEFDGVHLPVVKYPGRAALGIVTGEIEVVFKILPGDIQRYAKDKNLALVGEALNIKTVYFSAKNYPANLAAILESLQRLPEVERAEVSVIFGNRSGT